jgi:hypothetical protein
MPKRFRHLGEEWQATGTGIGHAVGFVGAGGALPDVDRWGVIFQSISRPERGEFRTSISESDPVRVDDEELIQALDEQLVLAAINRSRYIWRPAEAIARETGLDLDRVRFILDTTDDDVIEGERNGQGLLLYTTGQHLSKTAGDVMQRIYRVEESS